MKQPSPHRCSRLALIALRSSGCGSVTVSIRRGPLPEPDAEWYASGTWAASPVVWPFNAHVSGLSGAVGEALVDDTPTPFVGGAISATAPRRRGLYRLTSLTLNLRPRSLELGVSGVKRSPQPASVLPFVTAQRTRDDGVLTVTGPMAVVDSVDLDELPAVHTVRFELDNRPVEGWVLGGSFERLGWTWRGNAWVAPSGARHAGRQLQCRPGEGLTLPLTAQGHATAAWAVLHLPGRDAAGRGLLRREDWRGWLARGADVALAAGHDAVARLTCPASMREGDALVVVTDGSHPEFLFVDALQLSPLPE